MKVEPVSVRTVTGPRRLEADTRTAASNLPNSTPQDFASFDSIEISNPVAPPEQVMGSGASSGSSGVPVDAAIPYVEPTYTEDMRAPSLAAMLRTIKGYLAEDFQRAIEQHQAAQAAQAAQQHAAQQAPSSNDAPPIPVKQAGTSPGEKQVNSVDFTEPGSQPAIPKPAGGFKEAHAAPAPQPRPVHTEPAKPAPAPVKQQAAPPPPPPQHAPTPPQHESHAA